MFDLSSLNLPPTDGTLVDVGANLGAFFRCALNYMRPAKSLCIEMLGDLAEALRSDPMYHCPEAGRFVVHCAVGESRGMVRTRRTRFHPASSLLPCNLGLGQRLGMDFREAAAQEDVQMVRLDDLCASAGFGTIDLLKIDVQGYEARVLRGASKTLKQTERLIIEVILMPHYEGQSAPEEIRALLRGAGLEFCALLHQDIMPQTREVWEQDELWMRPA
jgi:FkbM family methyltransferase